jgi:ABC-type sugar transport system ATPase subunit
VPQFVQQIITGAILLADRFDRGTLEADGQPAMFKSPERAMARGIGLVPEDRHREGLMLDMTVGENLAIQHRSRGRLRRCAWF